MKYPMSRLKELRNKLESAGLRYIHSNPNNRVLLAVLYFLQDF